MRKNWKNLFVGMMVALLMAVAFAPNTEAAIGFPGRQQAAATTAEVQSAPVAEVATTGPAYTAIVCRVDDGKVVAEMYDISGQTMAAYFEAVGAKHGQNFIIMSTDEDEFKTKVEELKTLKDKVELVDKEGVIPSEVEEVLTHQLGTEDVFAAKVTFKDPNHKSWLEKVGKTVLGAVIPFAGGLF